MDVANPGVAAARVFAAGRALSRARLSAYSGFTAGFFRLHEQPLWVVAAFDVAAVALVVGGLHVLGTIASGKGVPDIIPPAEANVPADMSVVAEGTVPHVTVRERSLAAASDRSLMFSDPVVFNPYLQSLPGAPSTGRFAGDGPAAPDSPPAAAATPPSAAVPVPPTLLSYAGVKVDKATRVAKRLVPATGKTLDGALDGLLPGGRDVVSSLAGVTDAGGVVHVAAGPADVTVDVAHTATAVAGVAGTATGAVGHTVGGITGAATGAVGGVAHSVGGLLH
jgi:hypothetical protein